MKKEDIEKFFDKDIKIILKNRFVYNCCIQKINESSVDIEDKYGNLITIDYGEIGVVIEK